MADNKEKLQWQAEFPEEDTGEEERLRRKWERQQELKNAQREKRLREQKQKLRAIMILSCVLLVLIILVSVLIVNVIIPFARYQKANRLMEDGLYAEAIIAFRNMPGYRDADQLLEAAIRGQAVKLSGKEDVRYETTDSAPWFTITEQGELKFDEKKYTGDWQNVIVPDVFDGILVTALAEKAFAHCDKLLGVTISDCVLTLSKYAFLSCDGITEIVLPTHLTLIDVSAFEACSNLSKITFGNEISVIGASAFAYCDRFVSLTLPASVKELGSRSFNGCSALESVTLGASVEKIGSYAFSACTALKTILFQGTSAEWSTLVSNPSRIGLSDVTVVKFDTAH